MMEEIVEVFTDGACKGNPGAGGWGVAKPLALPKTEALGFRGDGDLQALVRNALAELRSNKG